MGKKESKLAFETLQLILLPDPDAYTVRQQFYDNISRG
jgi:hypothetical protein